MIARCLKECTMNQACVQTRREYSLARFSLAPASEGLKS